MPTPLEQLATGAQESIVLGTQTGLDALPAPPTASLIPMSNPRYSDAPGVFRSKAQTGSFQPRSPRTGKRKVDFGYDLECNESSVMPHYKAALGTWEKSGVGGLLLNHRYSFGPKPYLFAERRNPEVVNKDSSVGAFILTKNMMISTLGWNVPTEGLMEQSVGFVSGASIPSKVRTVANGDITDRTGFNAASYLLVRVTKTGEVLARSKAITLNLNNNAGTDSAHDQTIYQNIVYNEIPLLEGEFDFQYRCVDDLLEAMKDDPGSMEVLIPIGNGKHIRLAMPGFVFTSLSLQGGGTGPREGKCKFECGPLGHIAPRLRSEFFAHAGVDLGTSLAGKTLDLVSDGSAITTVTFTTEDTPNEVAATLNTALTAIGGKAFVERMAGEAGGCVVMETLNAGSTHTLEVKASSTGDALLGFDNTPQAGKSNQALIIDVANRIAA